MTFYADNEHRTNKLIIILNSESKINSVSDEFDYTIVKTNKMFEFKKRNRSNF